MARMSLDTAIRLSAEVKGGGNISKVQREIQSLAASSKLTARDLGTMRVAALQLAKANDGTVAGIRSSIAALRGLKDQVKIGGQEFRALGADIQKLEAKLKGLDGTATAAGASLGQKLATGLAAAGIGRGLQQITTQAGRFDAELRKAAAIEGGAGSFGVLREEIERVAAAAAGTPTEVAALATALSRAGFSAQETTQALAGMVRGAEATSISFEEMGSIAADNLRAFGLQTSATGRVVDVLTQTANKSNQTVLDLGESLKYAAPIARNLGVPLEDLAATMGLLANNGIRGSDAGTALRTGLTRLQIAASGSNEELEGLTRGNALLATAMRSLGAEIIDTRGNLLPLDQVILRLRENLQSMSTGRRAEIAKALFGDEAGSKFLALMNSSEEQITRMFGAVRNSGGVAEETQKKMQGFDYSIKVLGGNVENLTNQIGGMIGTALKPLIDGLNSGLGVIQKWPDPVKNFGAALAAAGVSTLGLVVAVNALKTALSVVGGIKAATAALTGYTGAATTAGTASAAAATSAGRLLTVLGTLGKIGLITIGVKFAIEGLDELITGLVGVKDAEAAARAMAERRGLTYVPSAAVTRRMPSGQQRLQSAGVPNTYTVGGITYDTATGRPVAGVTPFVPGTTPGAPSAPALPAPAGGGGGAAGGGSGASAKTRSIEEIIAARPFGREILAAAKANNVDPALFAALVEQESGNRQTAISRSGAIGLSQLMPGTARELGVDPYNAMQNLMGGARYLRQQLDRFGLEGGLRAYNQGPGAQQRTPGGNSQESREYPGRVLERYRRLTGAEGDIEQLTAEGLKSLIDTNKQREEQLKEQLNTSERMTRESQLQLNALRVSDPLLRAAVEAGNEELQIMQKYSDLKAQALSDDVKANYEAAQKNELESSTLKFSEQLRQQHSTMLDGLLDMNKSVRDRLAYDREYEGLVRTGINPELAKQLMELGKITKATYESLQARIATLELAASSLPVESAIRKELEAQAAALELQRASINDINKDTRVDLFSTYQKTESQKIESQIATLKNDLAEMTSIATVAGRSAEAIGGAFGNAFRDLISGAASARQVLSGFFEDVAQGFAQMASEIIAKQMAMIALQTILKALGAVAGAAGGGFAPSDAGPFGAGGVSTALSFDPSQMMPRALGGPTASGQPYKVGENGPELFVPYQAGSIIPAEATETLQAINNASMRGLQVPFQGGSSSSSTTSRSSSSSSTTLREVPFQRGMEGLAVPFQRGGDASGGMGGGGGSIDVKFETVRIGELDFVTKDEAQRIGRESAKQGAALAQKRIVNNPTTRRQAGLS